MHNFAMSLQRWPLSHSSRLCKLRYENIISLLTPQAPRISSYPRLRRQSLVWHSTHAAKCRIGLNLKPNPINARAASTVASQEVSSSIPSEEAVLEEESAFSGHNSEIGNSDESNEENGAADYPKQSPAVPRTTINTSRLLDFVDERQYTDEEHAVMIQSHQEKEFVNAPIFTSAAHEVVASTGDPTQTLIAQYGLVGIRQDTDEPPEDRLVLANLNTPWSAFICGSQGAGKSHTLSCLLENALIQNGAGELPHPLAGLVLHYDKYSNHSTTQYCEAAYLCSSGIPVNILVAPSNIWAMKRLYENLPGLPPGSPQPKVLPLYLTDKQLDIARILKMMAFDPTAGDAPLYMEVVTNLIRNMAMEGPGFSYARFRERLANTPFIRGQQVPLNMRLEMLDTFLAPSNLTTSTRPAQSQVDIWSFEPGTLTIVDLSDPFVSSEDACSMFSICLSIFLEDRGKCGRIVAMDEAHKSGEAKMLTGDLISIIRQQRHTGTRVLVATQEPTLSPQIIDLVNATFVHRFLSPAWYDVLKKHLAGANKHDTLFEKIIQLRTGESLLFCPTAQVDSLNSDTPGLVQPLANGYIRMKTRKRLSADGGKSILANEVSADSASTTTAMDEVPMHVVPEKPRVKRKGDPKKKDRNNKDVLDTEPPSGSGPGASSFSGSRTFDPSNKVQRAFVFENSKARIYEMLESAAFGPIPKKGLLQTHVREVLRNVETTSRFPPGSILTHKKVVKTLTTQLQQHFLKQMRQSERSKLQDASAKEAPKDSKDVKDASAD